MESDHLVGNDNVKESPLGGRFEVILNFVTYFLEHFSGIIYVITGSILYSLYDLIVFLESSHTHPMLIFLWVGTIGSFVTFIAVALKRPEVPFTKTNIIFILLNSVLLTVGSGSYIISDKLIGPADLAAIVYSSPFFASVMGRIFLKENFNCVHVFWCLFSVIGVFFVCQPSFIFYTQSGTYCEYPVLGYCLAGVTSFLFATSVVLTRKIGAEIHPVVTLLTMLVGVCVMSLVSCSFFKLWQLPESLTSFARILSCVFSFVIGFFFIFLSLSVENVKVVSILLTLEVMITRIGENFFLVSAWSWPSVLGSVFITVACVGIAVTSSNETDI